MKILYYKYFDNSATHFVRVYNKYYFEQAEKDLAMLQQHASSDKTWHLEDIEAYSDSKQTTNIR